MKKTIISAAFGASLLLLAAVPAFASADCENSLTGAYSNNHCTILAKKKAKLFLVNLARVTNNTTTDSNTGNNTSNMNTQGGPFGIVTGNASATSSVSTVVNQNNVTINQPCDNCTAGSGLNSMTGYESNNTVNIDNRRSVKVAIINAAEVRNYTQTTANTGNNSSVLNTIGGDILTGDANAVSGVGNNVNSNTVVITQ